MGESTRGARSGSPAALWLCRPDLRTRAVKKTTQQNLPDASLVNCLCVTCAMGRRGMRPTKMRRGQRVDRPAALEDRRARAAGMPRPQDHSTPAPWTQSGPADTRGQSGGPRDAALLAGASATVTWPVHPRIQMLLRVGSTAARPDANHTQPQQPVSSGPSGKGHEHPWPCRIRLRLCWAERGPGSGVARGGTGERGGRVPHNGPRW